MITTVVSIKSKQSPPHESLSVALAHICFHGCVSYLWGRGGDPNVLACGEQKGGIESGRRHREGCVKIYLSISSKIGANNVLII